MVSKSSPALWAAFITLRKILKKFSQSILVTAVCLSVCLSVCLFVCLSSKALQAARSVRSSWFFFQKMSSGHATMQNFFFWKSDEGQGQGHHFCENQIMGHNFWTGSDRDFGLVANVPYIIPLLSGILRFDVRRHIFTSRDFKNLIEKHIMGHNFWTGSDRDFWLAAKCSYRAALLLSRPSALTYDVTFLRHVTSNQMKKTHNFWTGSGRDFWLAAN